MSTRSIRMRAAGVAFATTLTTSTLALVDSIANADPTVRQVTMNCDDGSTFTAEFNTADESVGLPQTFRIVSGTGTGAAGDAIGFSWHLRTVTAPDGTVLRSDSAGSGVTKGHEVITCSTPAFANPLNTLHLTGFLLPADESAPL